jgi:DNA-binding beta-propeller fold protein YncE
MSNKFRKVCSISLTAMFGAAVAILAHATPQSTGYHLVKKVVLGGEGGWDYLNADSDTHRIFISHGTHVVVVDQDGNVVGDIPNLNGAHGAALAPDLSRGYITNGRGNSVTIFDLKSLQTIKDLPLPAARNPDGYLYDALTKRVFAFNGKSHDATAIDAVTYEVMGTVPLGGQPEGARTDGKGHIFVNIEDDSHIVQFDARTLKVLTTWPLPCKEPSGMAIDLAHQRLFTGCQNKPVMVAVDYTTGKVVDSVPIGDDIDSAWFDPATGLFFASCGDGTITAVHEDTPDKYTVVDTIKTMAGAARMAVDIQNHRLYAVSVQYGPAPAPTPENPKPRPPVIPGTFTLLIFAK